MQMHTVTAATSALYFQRFFLVEREADFDATRVAMACTWLAAKAREDPHRLRDIVNSFLALSSTAEKGKVLQMESYWALRDELVLYEQAVLRAMGFDAEPTPAYSLLSELAWLLRCTPGDHGVTALAWALLNDAFCSEICALSPPARVATACLLLAVELGRRVPQLREEAERTARHWDRLCREPCLEAFLGIGASSGADELEELCRDLLAVYEADRASAVSV